MSPLTNPGRFTIQLSYGRTLYSLESTETG